MNNPTLVKGLGYSYLFFGLLILLFSAFSHSVPAFFIPSDFFGGLVLLVIGFTFIGAISPARSDAQEAVLFTRFAILLSVVFASIYLILMWSNGILWLMGNEDFADWSPIDDLVPTIWLALGSIYLYWKSESEETHSSTEN